MKILSVIGTRPEAIKMAPVLRFLATTYPEVTSIVCVTAQHRQMLDQVLSLFDITPDFDLDLMRPDQSLARLTADALTGLDRVFDQTRPDWVLAQGDTTTAMVAALAAFYRQIPVGHVEAGLRTGNLLNPFPEEVNRRLADTISSLHFAPTPLARQNLLREGRSDSTIIVTGNTVIDALLDVASRPFDWQQSPLASVSRNLPILLVTTHRRESFGQPLISICHALRSLASRYPELQIVCPVHPNPNVRLTLESELANIPSIHLLPPLDYLPLVHLMKAATLILTDSGGIQEEAPSLHVPVLVLRDFTERIEAVQSGAARLVGTNSDQIIALTSSLLDHPERRREMILSTNPYGDGLASQRIVESIVKIAG